MFEWTNKKTLQRLKGVSGSLVTIAMLLSGLEGNKFLSASEKLFLRPFKKKATNREPSPGGMKQLNLLCARCEFSELRKPHDLVRKPSDFFLNLAIINQPRQKESLVFDGIRVFRCGGHHDFPMGFPCFRPSCVGWKRDGDVGSPTLGMLSMGTIGRRGNGVAHTPALEKSSPDVFYLW